MEEAIEGRLFDYDESTGIVTMLPVGIMVAQEVIRLWGEGMDLPEIEERLCLSRPNTEPGLGARILVAAADLSGALN